MASLSPLLVCVILSSFGFLGAKKHVILVLLILEYLSVFIIYLRFTGSGLENITILLLRLIFTCVASEGAMALTLFLAATRSRTTELSARNF